MLKVEFCFTVVPISVFSILRDNLISIILQQQNIKVSRFFPSTLWKPTLADDVRMIK